MPLTNASDQKPQKSKEKVLSPLIDLENRDPKQINGAFVTVGFTRVKITV